MTEKIQLTEKACEECSSTFRVLKVREIMFCSVYCKVDFAKKNPEYTDDWVRLYRKYPEKFVFNLYDGVKFANQNVRFVNPEEERESLPEEEEAPN